MPHGHLQYIRREDIFHRMWAVINIFFRVTKEVDMKITNNSQAPQGVHAVNGLVYIKPGQTKDVELTETGLDQAKRLPFLGIEGMARDLSAAPNSPPPANGLSQLDHDGNGAPGGAVANDPPSERDELKAQAAELGIEHAKNIATDKLRALIDAKLAE